MMVAMRDVPIDGDMIRLGQFLKLADLLDTGGEAKARIAAGEVFVNGEVDLRRGRQLHRGDVVMIRGERALVA
jgi:ribosome-associated protein